MSENKNFSASSSFSSDDGSKSSQLHENVRGLLQTFSSENSGDGYLSLISHDLTDVMIPELCEWLMRLDGRVNVLDLNDNQITSVGVSVLFNALKTNNSSVKRIEISRNKQIDDKCMKSLGEYIQANKNIGEIRITNNSLSDVGIDILTPYLEGNKTFKQFSFSGNKGITDKSIPILIKMIELSCIYDLGIGDTSINKSDLIYVALACSKIRLGCDRLDLEGRLSSVDDLMRICDCMKSDGISKLKEINLRSSKITSKGVCILSDTLRGWKSVVSKLDLSFCLVDDECMKSLGKYIENNAHLEALYISYNLITDKGIEILSDCLIGSMKLKELNLYYNKAITDASFENFIEIASTSCVSVIELWETSISFEAKREIYNAFKIPIQERKIPIKSNSKSAAKMPSTSA